MLSLSCSDYLSLPAVGIEIKNRLGAKNNAVSLSLPSQRVDRFDDDIANIISNSGKRSGLTFAPEAGTQRLRDIINKGLTNDELLRGIKTAWERGWRQVKLYFMIGLPGETDEDVLGIAETVEWLQRECRDGRWHLAVNVTISNFSPKPHTPFQWHSVSTSEFLRKQAMLKEAFSKLYQVKANFTPVKISAMEDFVARGDRRLGAVIKRAWELGATNDGWWQSEELAHAAWTRAIDEVGMTWKYRQVDQGEWDVMQHAGDERYRGYGGKGRVDRGALADARLDAPLPWDHIDTGISRWWLKTDLQRALEAATVPDCSHSGLCSECGVCGDEFGDNVVFPPPPVPEFTGHQRPDSTRAQRLRFRYSKTKEMMFIGHLDLMTTWDRAARRAALPVTSDGSPFNARQRIYTALPLPLGATASSEILEIYLTEKCDPHAIRDRLQAQLPPGLELWKEVEDVPITKLDGSLVEKVSVLVDSIEWYATVSSSESSSGLNDLGTAVSSLLSAKVLHLDRDALAKKKGSKSRKGPKGRRKQGDEGNVRPALLELEVVNSTSGSDTNTAVIRFKSAMQYGNPALSPAAVVALLEKEMGMSMSILRMHRSSVSMRPPSQPKVDVLRLRSLARMEGHLAVRRQFGLGAWSGGLESREQQPSS